MTAAPAPQTCSGNSTRPLRACAWPQRRYQPAQARRPPPAPSEAQLSPAGSQCVTKHVHAPAIRSVTNSTISKRDCCPPPFSLFLDRLASVRALAESADAGTDPSAVLSFIREALLFAPPPPQSPAPESPARTGSGEGEATSSPSATPGSRSASGTPSDPEAAAAGGGAPPPASAEDLVGANEALLAMLEQRLEQWDGVVRSFESPSRVLRWTRRDDTTAG